MDGNGWRGRRRGWGFSVKLALFPKEVGGGTFGLRQRCKSLTIGVAGVSASCCGVNLAVESRAGFFSRNFELR
jgi:hypothetical protein